MKRRNVDCGKIRRPVKRNKITEGIYGSTILYFKFFLVWALVLVADFVLEFRFEYLWPFWLLLHSVYDSFKYQGLAFSVFFVFIAFTSDMICLLFIPVHWLFFAASTYVWVQYVWHTERGVCLPTISLWLLFVYIEASVRLKEIKHLPFHLDLCRPFAAHWLRLKKQKEVAKENEFYMQLLHEALPPETPSIAANSAVGTKSEEANSPLTNGSAVKRGSLEEETHAERHEYQFMESQLVRKNNTNMCEDSDESGDQDPKTGFKTLMRNSSKWNHTNGNLRQANKAKTLNNVANNNTKEETSIRPVEHLVCRLEGDVKRLKSDLQASRQVEQELRAQIHSVALAERTVKNELSQLHLDNENLQNKLHNLVTARQQDKQNAAQLEKKLQEEKKLRTVLEGQLAAERKAKKAEEAAARALAATRSGECTEACKARRRELESEVKTLGRELKLREEQLVQAEREAQALRQYKEAHGDTEVLMSALSAMQDKNAHLENSLSAETRLKLDLFSALGEAKRQLEISQKAFGDATLSCSRTFEWFSRFQKGREKVNDDQHTGRPRSLRCEENMLKIKELIKSYRRIYIKDLSSETGLSVGLCHQIVTKDLDMIWTSSKFVPQILTEEQKEVRMDVCKKWLKSLEPIQNGCKKSLPWMRHGCISMTRKPKVNPANGLKEGNRNPKRQDLQNPKSRHCLLHFFILMVWFTMNLFLSDVQLIKRFIWG
ncbi:TMEM57 [Cordylochernes scorpioides]|uniref:Macoilin n=1 Tax=Cordylochernes scorpioides TaxID=51811 RepID=A0ABY6LTS9_9ARAC|nr:TMEM57 [Cordylochernes scorpioides]